MRGTYRIERLIACNGVAAVYEAEHLRLRRRIAIKMLLDAHAKDPRVLSRFRRAVMLVSQLRHPHIVQILDADDADEGRPFFVMEYLHGEDAGARLHTDGPFSIPDVVRIVGAVSSALTDVHAEGMVHGRLEPASIFLARVSGQAGFAKLIGFGTGVDVATTVDPAGDQFALAATTYELLSGRRAFPGAHPAEVGRAIASGEPRPLSSVAPLVPSAFDPVLRRALSGTPDERYPSVAVFASALAHAAIESGFDPVDRVRSDAPSGRYSLVPAATEDLGHVTLRPRPVPEPAGLHDRPSRAPGVTCLGSVPAATPESLVQMARLHFGAGRLDDAVTCAEHLLELGAHDRRAPLLRALGAAIPLIDAIFEARTGSDDLMLLPGPRLAELRQLLSTHAARLVAFVDGPTKVGDLLSLSKLPRRDAVRLVAGLLRRGAIRHG